MAEFGVGFKLWGDSSQLNSELRKAGESAKGLKRQFNDTFGEGPLGKFLSIGGVITGVVAAFKSTLDAASEMRKEFVELGKAVPDSVRSVAEANDSVARLFKSVKEGAVEFLSFWTRAGEGIGMTFNLIFRGMEDGGRKAAQQYEETAKALEETEKRIAQARKDNSPEKLLEADKKLAEARKAAALQQADDMGKVFLLLQRQHELEVQIENTGKNTVRRRELEADLAKTIADVQDASAKSREVTAKREEEAAKQWNDAVDDQEAALGRLGDRQSKLAKLKFDQLSDTEKEVQLTRELDALNLELAAAKSKGLETSSEEIAVLEKSNELSAVRAELTKGIASNTRDTIDKEAERIKQLVATANSWLGGMRSIRNGQQLNDASDETLKQIVLGNRQKASDATNPAIYGITSARANSMEAAALNFEADNAQSILDSRSKLRNDVQLGGIDYARRNYSGDPTLFDSLVQRWVTDTRSQTDILKEQNQQLTDLNSRLAIMGFKKS